MSDVRPLSSLTYEDWTEFHWTEVAGMSDGERMFVKGLPLTPPERGEMAAKLKGSGVRYRPRTYNVGGEEVTIFGAPGDDGQVLGGIGLRRLATSKPERPKRTGLARWLLGE